MTYNTESMEAETNNDLDLDGFDGHTEGPWKESNGGILGATFDDPDHGKMSKLIMDDVGKFRGSKRFKNIALAIAAPELLALAKSQSAEIERLREALDLKTPKDN